MINLVSKISKMHHLNQLKLSSILVKYRSSNFIQIKRFYNRHHHHQQSNDTKLNIFKSIDPYSTIIGTICFSWFSLHTLFKENLTEKIQSLNLIKNANIPVDMEESIADLIKNSQLNDSLKQTLPAKFYITNHCEPFVVGSMQTHFGSSIWIPFYYQFNNDNDIEQNIASILKLFKINQSSISLEILEQLKQCLKLSENAKNFALLSLFYNNSMLLGFQAEVLSLFITPYLIYALTNQSLKRISKLPIIINPLIRIISILCGYYLYFNTILPTMKQLQYRYGYYCIFKHEPSNIRNGYDEYFDKLNNLNEIIDKYSTKTDANHGKTFVIQKFIQACCSKNYYSYKNQLTDCQTFDKIGPDNLKLIDLLKF